MEEDEQLLTRIMYYSSRVKKTNTAQVQRRTKVPLFTCFALSFAIICVNLAAGEVLTPPYFNLAQGRRITASATCGEGTNEPELYCKLVGANADTDININVIQGQVIVPNTFSQIMEPLFIVSSLFHFKIFCLRKWIHLPRPHHTSIL